MEIAGTTLLERAVELLAARGLTRFTIVDGYRGEMVRAALTARFPPAWFHFVRNAAWATTGNAYSLHLARPPEEEPMFLLDSDIAFEPGVLDRLLAAPAPNRLALRSRGACGAEEMKVLLDDRGLVHDISKEIPPAEAAGESVGLEIFSAAAGGRLFEILAGRVAEGPGLTEFYESSFVALIRGGAAVHPVDLGALECMEIDTPEDLERAGHVFGAAR